VSPVFLCDGLSPESYHSSCRKTIQCPIFPDMKKQLADSILFSGISPEDVALVEASGSTMPVSKGAFVFLQDDPADCFYIVLSGKIKVVKTSPDGKEQILLMAQPGESFGEAALFARTSYPASAEVVEDGELISFSREKFTSLIHARPALAMNLIARLSMLLHHLTRLIQHLSLEDISTRLAGYLVDSLESDKAAPQRTIVLSEKKMDMAAILGTIPETLSRAFARLSKLGIIAVDGQEVTILDAAKLTDVAAGRKIQDT